MGGMGWTVAFLVLLAGGLIAVAVGAIASLPACEVRVVRRGVAPNAQKPSEHASSLRPIASDVYEGLLEGDGRQLKRQVIVPTSRSQIPEDGLSMAPVELAKRISVGCGSKRDLLHRTDARLLPCVACESRDRLHIVPLR